MYWPYMYVGLEVNSTPCLVIAITQECFLRRHTFVTTVTGQGVEFSSHIYTTQFQSSSIQSYNNNMQKGILLEVKKLMNIIVVAGFEHIDEYRSNL